MWIMYIIVPMQMNTELHNNSGIEDLLSQSKASSFRQGVTSVFTLFPQDIASDQDIIGSRINKVLEESFSRFAGRGLLYHQLSPSIENYWKNVGAYFFMAIDDVQREIDDKSNSDQMKLL